MLKTNINIQRGRQKLKYGVEYIDNSWSSDSSFLRWRDESDYDGDRFQFFVSTAENCVRSVNTWSAIDWNDHMNSQNYIPSGSVGVSSFNIYFPHHSVETYVNNNYYIAEFTTYVNGDKIILGCFLIDRRKASAYPGIKMIAGERYYEYVNLIVPDAWDIVYSDDWAPFRQSVCNEPASINNTGSLIGIELHPVFWNGDQWEKHHDFIGGSNSVLLTSNDTDYLAPHISIEADGETEPKLRIDYRFNRVYDSLEQYIYETYQTSGPIDARTSVILHDKDSVYNYYYLSGTQNPAYVILNEPSSSSASEIPFTGWTGLSDTGETIEYWKDGLMLTAYFSIYSDGLPIVSVCSNRLPVTKELFSVLIKRDQSIPYSVDLDSIPGINISINGKEMTDINVVNKIEKNIVNIQRPSDTKGGISRPVFIRVNDNGPEIQIHPEVTESIGVNLQKYKNAVKRFTMKISGVEFPESGRLGANVVFKINAGSLPSETAPGIYYILDDNKELVTFGNYTV